MRARKTVVSASDSTPAKSVAKPRARALRPTGARADTRPAAQVTQLAARATTSGLPRTAVATSQSRDADAPRLDGARAVNISVVRQDASSPTARRDFRELREALVEGWEIVQPIFARPLWSAADDSATAFSFVLRGPSGTRLITVPEGRSVERFIRDRRLSVDYAH